MGYDLYKKENNNLNITITISIYLCLCLQNALKSCKQQAKNLADMAKEIEAIERVTSPGDLPSRLEAAENATVDVEKRLAKTVSTLTILLW